MESQDQIADKHGERLFFPVLAPFYQTGTILSYALLRVMFGLVLLSHGLPKALGTSHGSLANPMAGATNMIANVLHLPFAPLLATAAMLLETVGAVAIIVGLMTRPLAAALAVEMAVICFAHGPTFAWIDRGFEYPLVLGFIALHIAIAGGGRFSVDALLGKTI